MNELKNMLYAQFENIPSRRGRGGVYSYVRWQDVADRMNNIFGTQWSSRVEYQDVVEGNVIIRVSVCIYDVNRDKEFCQEGFGGAPLDAASEAGNPFKSAYSKALKDACKKWGVGLYIDEDEPGQDHQPRAEQSPPPGYVGRETANPVEEQQKPSLPTPPPLGNKSEEPVPVEKEPEPEPQPRQQPTPGGLPAPPPLGGGSSPAQPSQGPPAQEKPAPQTLSTQDDLPMSNSGVGGQAMISDVQKTALNSILDVANISFKELAQEAFEVRGITDPVPDNPDQLNYQNAVIVVKYGNDKFRKR